MNLITKRALLLGSGALIGGYISAKNGAKNPILDGTTSLQPKNTKNLLNDASGLSETPIHKHIIIEQDPDKGLVSILRNELKTAKIEGHPVSLSSLDGRAIYSTRWASHHTSNQLLRT
jgi:hypothetical protein